MAAKQKQHPSEFLNDQDKKIAQELDEFCCAARDAQKDGGEMPKPINSNNLWKFLYKCAKRSPNMMFQLLFNTVQLYRSIVPAFAAVVDPFIAARLKELEAKNNSTASRIEVAIPLIRLIPFLDDISVLTIVHNSCEIVEKNLRQKHELPIEFLTIFKDVVVEDMDASAFRELVNYFKEIELTADNVAVLAQMAGDMEKIDESLLSFFNQILVDFLGSEDRDSKLAGCWFLHKFAYRYEGEPELVPPEVTDMLLQLLTEEDAGLCSMAHKAARTLVKIGIFLEEQAITSIVNLFGDYNEKMIFEFFRLIRTIFYPNDDKDSAKDMNLFVPIREFAIEQLSSDDTNLDVKGCCVNIIADLMSIKKSFVVNCRNLAWQTAVEILEKKAVTAYPRITPFLVGSIRLYPKKKAIVSQYITDIIDELQPKEKRVCGTISERLDMAIDIAEMITLGVLDSPPPVIGTFAIKGLSSKNIGDAVRSCAIFLEALPVLSEATATQALEKIAQHAREADTIPILEFFIKTMRKLLERFDVKKNKNFHKFFEDFIRGRLKNFQGKPGALLSEGMKLIDCCIKKYPDMIPKILSIYEEFSPKVEPNHVPLFVAPYKTVLSVVRLSDENLKKLWTICVGYLAKSAERSPPGVLASLETLIEIWNSNNYVCDQLDTVISVCSYWIEKMDVSHLDDIMKFIIEMMPTMAYFLFLVLASGREVKISNDVLDNILRSMPFPPEVKIQGELMRQMAKVVKANRLPKLEKDMLVTMVELLVLDEKDFNEFELEESAIQAMKQVVKAKLSDPKLCKGVKGLMINAQRDREALAKLIAE